MPDVAGEKQTLEERLLSEGVAYALGNKTFPEAIEAISIMIEEHDEDCHCCRMPYCECDENAE